MQEIKVVFNGSVNDGAKDCKVLSALERFELARYFLFDFDVPDGSFWSIIIRRNLMIITRMWEYVADILQVVFEGLRQWNILG